MRGGRARQVPTATAVVALCAALLVGCAGGARLPADAPSVRLDEVPFEAQARYQCGPAALATVLRHAGVDTNARALVPEVWIPGRRGSLAVEMLGATRRGGRIPWVLRDGLGELIAELDAGRSVLVFQNLGIAALPAWHYAVVIGVDPARGEVLLRSGTERLVRTPVEVFDRTWARAGRWAMVALEPGERPARPERGRWLAAIADVEAMGRVDLAHAAWSDWLADHPDDPVARFGHAATAATRGELDLAAAEYGRLLETRGEDLRVLNNLAEVRARQGCTEEARALLARALELAPGSAARAVLDDTRAEIERLDAAGGLRCP